MCCLLIRLYVWHCNPSRRPGESLAAQLRFEPPAALEPLPAALFAHRAVLTASKRYTLFAHLAAISTVLFSFKSTILSVDLFMFCFCFFWRSMSNFEAARVVARWGVSLYACLIFIALIYYHLSLSLSAFCSLSLALHFALSLAHTACLLRLPLLRRVDNSAMGCFPSTEPYHAWCPGLILRYPR